MSFLDDLGSFGSGMLDSVGEGFDNLVDAATTSTDSVNANTQPQSAKQADNNGNAVTGGSQVSATADKTMLYVGGGIAAVLVLGLFVLALKK